MKPSKIILRALKLQRCSQPINIDVDIRLEDEERNGYYIEEKFFHDNKDELSKEFHSDLVGKTFVISFEIHKNECVYFDITNVRIWCRLN